MKTLVLLSLLTLPAFSASPGKTAVSIEGEASEEGYQSPPVNWGISSGRKRAFFKFVAEITGFQIQ